MSAGISTNWAAFGRRIIGAMRLNGATYREASRDPDALPQAMAVILLSSLASAIVFLIDKTSPGLSVDVDWGSYPITRESNAAAALAGGILDGSWGLHLGAAGGDHLVSLEPVRQPAAAISGDRGAAGIRQCPFDLLRIARAHSCGRRAVWGAVGLFWALVASVVALRSGLETGWGRATLLLVISVVILLPLSVMLSIAA